MSSSMGSIAKTNALETIKYYRVSELQSLLECANLSRRGQKRDLLQRCRTLITTNYSTQLASKIQQINNSRSSLTRIRPHAPSSTSSSSSSSRNHPIVIPKTPPLEVLPQSNHIQFMNLPFFEKMRTIESSNMPVDWHTFSPLRFSLNETDIDLVRKSIAKVFLRIAPTIVHEKQNDVLPPYLFVQCNNQPVINNNISKQVGAQAHSISFPADITDKLILKPNASNSLTFLWLQSPTSMSFKNLPRSYTFSIQLVHCVSIETLFDLILKREPYVNKAEQDNDSDIEIEDLGLMTTRHRVSLLCPITQSLIAMPAKSSDCSHLTCFDLRAFLLMNERRLQWTCPLCKKSASFESLRVDKRLQVVLSNVPSNCSTVEIDTSTECHYILDSVKQEKVDAVETMQPNQTDEELEHNSSTKSRCQSDESDCIVLSSGSESEDEETNNDDVDDEPNNRALPDTPVPTQNDDNDDRRMNKMNDNTSQSSHTLHSTLSSVLSTVDDTNYWEDIAQITYDLSSDVSEKCSNRKRSNSSASSVLSSASSRASTSSCKSNDDHHRRKRNKRASPNTTAPTSDIEIIMLSSSEDSDNNDQ